MIAAFAVLGFHSQLMALLSIVVDQLPVWVSKPAPLAVWLVKTSVGTRWTNARF